MANRIDVVVTGLKASSIPAVFKTVVLMSNIGIIPQVHQENTRYVIRWNYDLDGQVLEVPAGCIFYFEGGQLSNGTVHWNNTKVYNPYKYEILRNITERGNRIDL